MGLIRRAVAEVGCAVEVLGVPSFKEGQAVREAAAVLGVPLVVVEAAALEAVQGRCRTRSATAERAVGMASVAEAAALAAAGEGAVLLLPRIASGSATCAVAG